MHELLVDPMYHTTRSTICTMHAVCLLHPGHSIPFRLRSPRYPISSSRLDAQEFI